MKKQKFKRPAKMQIVRIFLFLVGLISLSCLICVFAYTKPLDRQEDVFVYDDMELFSDSQELQINVICSKIQEKNKLLVYVSTCQRINGSAQQWGDDFCRQHNLSNSETFVVIIINATDYNRNYHFDIYTYGDSERKISDKEIENILYSEGGDLILTSSSTNTVLGLEEIINKLGSAYSWILPNSNWILICALSLLIALLIAFIVIQIVKKSYSKHRLTENYNFATNTKLRLEVKEDNFVNSVVTSVVIAGGTSGSGNLGGGHYSGGGGGGGHRGGR